MATTSQSHPLSLDRTTEEGRTTNRWTEIWNPAIVSRVAGAGALAVLAVLFLSVRSQFHSDMSAQRTLAWVSQNQQGIWIDGFLSGLGNTLLALLIVLLVALTMKTGILARVAYIGAAAAMATAWVHAGVEYALADLAHRGGADAGILALFSFARTMDYTDGVSIALAVGCSSLLLLRSPALPRTVAWLGLLMAVEQIVAMPIQLAVSGTGNGPQGPISVALGLLWLLVIGIVLLVKSVRLSHSPGGNEHLTA
jgi:hypothetical protein